MRFYEGLAKGRRATHSDGELVKAFKGLNNMPGCSSYEEAMGILQEKSVEKGSGQDENEITDEFFTQSTGISVFKEDKNSLVLEIMCNGVNKIEILKSAAQKFIESLLEIPSIHKDIQFLENFGIKKLVLSNLIAACDLDFDIVETVIFMLKNGFFSKKEVMDNLSLDEPIPFFNSDVVIDLDSNVPGSGFSVSSKSKLYGIPDEIKAQGSDAIIAYANERLERLKLAVREDYFIRLKANEEGRKLTFKP